MINGYQSSFHVLGTLNPSDEAYKAELGLTRTACEGFERHNILDIS